MLLSFQMSSTTTISATAQQVWNVFREVQAWPRWSKVCTQVQDVSPDLWAVGAPFSFRLRMAGVGVPFSVRVTESQPPHKVAWASTVFTITAVRAITFEESDGATLVTDNKRFSSPLLPIGLVYPRWLISSMTRAWLRDLKAEAERRTANP